MSAIALEAKSWTGTPFHYGASVKGVGVDCVGLVRASLEAGGVTIEDTEGYGDGADHIVRLQSALESKLIKVAFPKKDLEPGDVLLFRGTLMYHHLGIVSVNPESFIHAHTGNVSAVTVSPIAGYWRRYLYAVYRCPSD